MFITNLRDEQLNVQISREQVGFVPSPIKYPISQGNLQKLALFSFQREFKNPIEDLARLPLPSKIYGNPQLVKRFHQERLRLMELGLADKERITELGQKCLNYIELEDLHFAKLLAQASGPFKELKVPIAVMCAASEIGLKDLCSSDVVLHGNTPLVREQLLYDKSLRKDDNAMQACEIIKTYNLDCAKPLLNLGINPLLVKDIIELLKDGFYPMPFEEHKFNKISDEYRANLQNYICLRGNEKIEVNPRSDLITIYNIIAYFYNHYYAQLDRYGLTEIEREEILYRMQDSAADFDLEFPAVRGVCESLNDILIRLINQKEIKIKSTYIQESELSESQKQQLLVSGLEGRITSDEGHWDINWLLKFYKILDGLINDNRMIKYPHPRKIPKCFIQKASEQLNTIDSTVSKAYSEIIYPVQREFEHQLLLLGAKQNMIYLPRLDEYRQKLFLEFIRKTGFHKIVDIEEFIRDKVYRGFIEDQDGYVCSAELQLSNTGVEIKDKKVKIMAKFRPIQREYGKVFIASHITLLQ